MSRYERVGLTAAEYDALLSQLGREPNDVELEIVGALWSEHCSYKSSRALLAWFGPTVASGANAGTVALDDRLDVVFKVESHNHPSFIEPFHGAATGVGGIIRDVLAMGAEPVALLDSLRFGPGPHGRRLLPRVVAGIAFYGNAIGIPTVGGEVAYGPGYETNPLVNVMCVGLRPADRRLSAAVTVPGHRLLLVGAPTGRDGIHGASLLASRAFDDADREELRPAVQVGDPFLGKLLVEAVLAAVATGRVAALQDLGAAGLSSALAEMAAQGGLGVRVDVAAVPRREAGMRADEVMLSESQERMVMAVAPADVPVVREALRAWDVAVADIGEVVAEPVLEVTEGAAPVAVLPARLLTHGCPRREAPATPRVVPAAGRPLVVDGEPTGAEALRVLAHPECRTRRRIFRQYDAMVKTATVAGPGGDAAILRIRGAGYGLALTVDGQARYGAVDPYAGGGRAVLEAAMNLVVTGAWPLGLSDGLNGGDPDVAAQWDAFQALVAGVADAARALGIPVTGGNVSLYNRTGDRAVWPTAVIGMVGRHPDPARAVGIGLPPPPADLVLLGWPEADLAATVWRLAAHDGETGPASRPDFTRAPRVLRTVERVAVEGLVRAAHDVSDGGLFATVAEMLLAPDARAGGVDVVMARDGARMRWFNEAPLQAVVAVAPEHAAAFSRVVAEAGVPAHWIGRVTDEADGLRWCDEHGQVVHTWPKAVLEAAWNGEDDHGR